MSNSNEIITSIKQDNENNGVYTSKCDYMDKNEILEDILARLEFSGSEDTMLYHIERKLIEIIVNYVKIASNKVSLDAEFFVMGVDSNNLVKMIRELEEFVGDKVYPTTIFQYSTIRKLALGIESEYGEILKEKIK